MLKSVSPVRMGLLVASAVCLIFSVGFSTPSRAALISYSFNGSVATELTGSPLAGTFSFGQSVTGGFVVDTSVPDADGGSLYGFFPGGLVSISVDTGGYNASGTNGLIDTADNAAGSDAVGIAAFITAGPFVGSASVTGASVAGLDLGGILISLMDSTGTALSSDAFPNPISLSGFDDIYGVLEFYDPQDLEADPTSLTFSLETIEVTTSVPAPAVLPLFALGLVGLGFARRKRAA